MSALYEYAHLNQSGAPASIKPVGPGQPHTCSLEAPPSGAAEEASSSCSCAHEGITCHRPQAGDQPGPCISAAKHTRGRWRATRALGVPSDSSSSPVPQAFRGGVPRCTRPGRLIPVSSVCSGRLRLHLTPGQSPAGHWARKRHLDWAEPGRTSTAAPDAT